MNRALVFIFGIFMLSMISVNSYGMSVDELIFYNDIEKLRESLPEILNKSYSLHLAASYGRLEVMKLFLDAGQDPNVRDTLRNTPLHSAVAWSNTEAVALLLERNADASAKDWLGCTLLHALLSKKAVDESDKNKCIEICNLLVNAGVNLEAQDDFGNTALSLATQYNYTEIRNLLKETLRKRKKSAAKRS